MNVAIHGAGCTVQIVVVFFKKSYETLHFWGKCNQFLIMILKQDRLAVMNSEGYKFKTT